MTVVRLAALVMVAAMTACSSPSPQLYTIAPVPGAVQTGGPKVVALQQISMARYLERSQIVRSSENYRLDVMSNDWWGEPLGAMLSRVLIEELSQRLPQSTVIGESGAVTASPDATIELNMQRLDEDTSGNLVLQAQASVSFKGRQAPVLRNFRFVVTPPAAGVQGEVNAISTAVGQLADGLGSMLVMGR
ncbi:MAG: PqiC family protein [Stellaceae bacterium]